MKCPHVKLILHALAVLAIIAIIAIMLGGMALMVGQRRLAGRLLLLGVFLAVMVGFV